MHYNAVPTKTSAYPTGTTGAKMACGGQKSRIVQTLLPCGVHVASQVALVVKNLPASAGDTRDTGSIPGSGRSPERGNGNPLQYSCLENPMDRGAWWATVHAVAESGTTK